MSKIVLLNYADENFALQQKYNFKSAKLFGGFDKFCLASNRDVDEKFKQSNSEIFNIKRGGGLWLWKPYIILKTLKTIGDDDVLVYCDSGAVFIRKISHLVEFMNERNLDILLFDIPLLEVQFTKKNVLDFFNSDGLKNQIMAGYILVKKTDFTLQFINEWLHLCQNIDLLYDDGKMKQCDSFLSHREDQSLLSLLAHSYELPSFREPTQYGERPWEYMGHKRFYCPLSHDESNYPQILISSRKRHPVSWCVLEIVKSILYKSNIYTEDLYINRHGYK
ncbi:hypothetical protein ACRFA2_05210 [Bacteroides hominis]|uniref:hypothetical protein n=1 Tax=Bacteroides TaxID=816 RepID=UPI0013EA2B71|nr:MULTISPECIES: hypothetical protein [Bacteroides]MBV4191029.1 hypothetical protein [Bacteroides fragilis]MDV6172084.1 hypothetical protein [Bacteroides hominis (ex Liu et al. 2022)]QTO26069.1 hypothetical protein G7Y45_00220 [Bacteroides sp. ZJ-18]